MQYLDPRDVIADFKFPDFSKSYSGRIQALKPDQIERLGGMMVWDLNKKQAVPLHREQVGYHFVQSGIDPALTGTYPRQAAEWPRSRRVPIYQMYLVHLQDYDLDTVASDHPRAEGPDRAVGRGIRARSSPRRCTTAKASATISI